MCAVCGCGTGEVRIEGAAAAQANGHAHHHGHAHGHHGDHDHHHDHEHDHHHDHHHGHGAHHHHAHASDGTLKVVTPRSLIAIEKDILAGNDVIAARNRALFAAAGILALNFVSSPGSGKTSLLVATLKRLAGKLPMGVVEGDQETSADADRIRATGVPAIQVNTGKGCHLDAAMVEHAFGHLPMPTGGILFIENVGNLVCPAGFDLGEAHKVVVASVTEGEDKPLKYPNMFAAADLMVVTKTDLAPHCDVDVAKFIDNARRINPRIGAVKVSVKTGEGMDQWIAWLDAARAMRAVAA